MLLNTRHIAELIEQRRRRGDQGGDGAEPRAGHRRPSSRACTRCSRTDMITARRRARRSRLADQPALADQQRRQVERRSRRDEPRRSKNAEPPRSREFTLNI
ncbi:MAG: hypothetical protein MZW92_38920 [Comamonadaceae bacterium]|nr:hypothetical protein [Comamonadaceae bacterium]